MRNMEKKNGKKDLLNATISSNGWEIEYSSYEGTTWDYWQDYWYPYVIKESYPVYIQEKAIDKGRKAFEIIKMLRDKKLLEVNTVKKFIELMDTLIKIL